MNCSKKLSVFVGACVVLAAIFVGVKLQSMKPPSEEFKFTLKSRRRGREAQQPRYKNEMVWVKTSDNTLMELPQWQVDQMKAVQQVGKNSKDNPANVSMVTSAQLVLIQNALHNASNLEGFKKFYDDLSDDQKASLLANTFTLGMQGLASLLIKYIFPLELQQKMGATVPMGTQDFQPASIVAPVFHYLKSVETLPLSHTGPVHHVATPDGKRIISAAAGVKKNLILYDLTTGEQKNLLAGTSVINDVVFSPNSQFIAATMPTTVLLLDGYTGQILDQFDRHEPWLTCAAFTHDNYNIIIGSEGALLPGLVGERYPMWVDEEFGTNLIMYDVETMNRKKGFIHTHAPIHSLVCSSNNKYIVAGAAKDSKKSVFLFSKDITDSWSQDLEKNFKGLAAGKVCVAISPYNNLIVAGSSKDSELIMWDIASGEQRASLKGHGGVIRNVTFSPDGKYIVSVSSGEQNNVIVWDVKTGELITAIEGFKDVHCITFTPDGNYLLCGGKEGVKLLKFILPQILKYIAPQLNIAQARFLYRLYLAKINNVPVVLDQQELDYQLYKTLPFDVQDAVKTFLSFELTSDIFEKEVQQKMSELRSLLFYVPGYVYGRTEKTHEEKIKAVKDAMLKFDPNSAEYKACERLLAELKLVPAFKLIEGKK